MDVTARALPWRGSTLDAGVVAHRNALLLIYTSSPKWQLLHEGTQRGPWPSAAGSRARGQPSAAILVAAPATALAAEPGAGCSQAVLANWQYGRA